MNRKIILAFVCSAILVMTATYGMQTRENISRAKSEINAIIEFVEEQCIQYDNILQTNHVRSQVSAIDSATELARDILHDEAAMSQERLEEFILAQRLEGVMVLDENLNLVAEAGKNSDYGYSFWSSTLSRKAIQNVLNEENVSVVNHFQDNQDYYSYAAVPRQDQKGVIFCYSRETSVAFTYDGDSLENLLVGYKIDKNGTVALTDGEKVISANDSTMQGQLIENCPRIMMFNEKWIPDELVRVTKNKQVFYGVHVRCNQYYIYVFFPEKRIFEGRASVMAYAVSIFLGIWAVILLTRQHAEAKYRDQLYQSMQDARQANAAKTEFLRRMSHDIRTPINGILGMLDIAEHFPDDAEKQKECRQKIRSASLFLFDLVNDVLDMSKMETGNIRIEEVPFQLKNSISEVASLMEVQAVEKGILFSVDIPAQGHWDVIGSPLHLRQILINVASNAVKYNRENGSVHLSCREIRCEEDTVWFEFVCQDTGVGMSEEFQKTMFEPFTQENDAARTNFNGTGLGLSIVKKLVDMMGGTIQVQSARDVGSTFTITLPFHLQHQKESKKETLSAVKAPFSLEGARIMLVEDNTLNMEIAQFTLENKGAEVVKAWNGEEAVELFAHSRPGEYTAILMDIMMPVMDGITATGKIRELNRKDAATIPIIAMTANAFADDVDKNKAAGMNAQLSKPLEVDKLIQVITDYMC